MRNSQIALLCRQGFLFLACSICGDLSAQEPAADSNRARAAAELVGLDFTDEEIEALSPSLEDFRKAYSVLRQMRMPNEVSPALIFNPIPPGVSIEKDMQRPVRLTDPGEVSLPEDLDDLAFYSVIQLARLIENRQITSEELTRFCLDRLKKYDPQLHCVVSLTEELALEQARRADEEIAAGNYRGLLHGIPYGAKDLLATREYKTTWGAAPYQDQQFDYDATVIQRLEEAGAVLCAKLSLGSLAMGDVWFKEKTRNPWDPTKGSSGSSAGSASAVAAGLLPFAIGTETLGSIISPSTICGTTGLRPTFGRVSRHGAMALSWSMDKIGPICRSAEDCAAVFQVILGPDGKDLSVNDYPFNYDAVEDSVCSLRIGYHQSAFDQDYGFKEQDAATLETLRNLGHELIPIELPEMPDIGFILTVEAAAAFDELTLSGQDDLLVRQARNAWPNIFRKARFVPAVEYIQANRARTLLMQEMNQVFEKVDVYVHPSWAGSSLRITNFTGHPSIVVPNGFQKDGTPTSISFTGKLYQEGDLILIASQWQSSTPFEEKHPDLQK